MNLEPLGELETSVMEAVWALAPTTAREVHDHFGDSRAYTTIMTTLDRLHHKGLLAREKDGLAWRYQPTLGKAAYERAVTDHEVGHRPAASMVTVFPCRPQARLLDPRCQAPK